MDAYPVAVFIGKMELECVASYSNRKTKGEAGRITVFHHRVLTIIRDFGIKFVFVCIHRFQLRANAPQLLVFADVIDPCVSTREIISELLEIQPKFEEAENQDRRIANPVFHAKHLR